MSRQRGYIAILTILLVGAAALAIASGLLLTATDAQRSTLLSQQSVQARNLASACAEEGLQQLQSNNSFTGTNNLSMGQGTCTYTVANTGGTGRSVAATGTVGNAVRKVQVNVTVGVTTLTVTSWQEVAGTPATVAHVQSIGLADGPGTGSSTLAFSSNVTAGNLIVASASWDSSGGVVTMTCSDNRGNNYSTVNVWDDTTNHQTLAVCYAANAAAGATTVTATYGNGATLVAFRHLAISEYSGVATSFPVDTSTGVGGATATTAVDAVTSGAATTSQNGDLIYGAVMDTTSTTTIAAGTGFTQRVSINAKDLAVQDQQQAIAGSIASTQTFGTTHRYNAAMVAFKALAQ